MLSFIMFEYPLPFVNNIVYKGLTACIYAIGTKILGAD